MSRIYETISRKVEIIRRVLSDRLIVVRILIRGKIGRLTGYAQRLTPATICIFTPSLLHPFCSRRRLMGKSDIESIICIIIASREFPKFLTRLQFAYLGNVLNGLNINELRATQCGIDEMSPNLYRLPRMDSSFGAETEKRFRSKDKLSERANIWNYLKLTSYLKILLNMCKLKLYWTIAAGKI